MFVQFWSNFKNNEDMSGVKWPPHIINFSKFDETLYGYHTDDHMQMLCKQQKLYRVRSQSEL
jgi:hypothetical protein